jgi:hypothetical protein
MRPFNILSLSGAAIDSAFAVAQLAAAFENAFCVMTNAFLDLLQFPDYTDLYGASVCSSTSGGSPLSPLRGQNAWELIVPAPVSPVSVTAEAQSSIALFRNMDPALVPIPLSQMARQLSLIGSGVTFQ